MLSRPLRPRRPRLAATRTVTSRDTGLHWRAQHARFGSSPEAWSFRPLCAWFGAPLWRGPLSQQSRTSAVTIVRSPASSSPPRLWGRLSDGAGARGIHPLTASRSSVRSRRLVVRGQDVLIGHTECGGKHPDGCSAGPTSPASIPWIVRTQTPAVTPSCSCVRFRLSRAARSGWSILGDYLSDAQMLPARARRSARTNP